MNQPVTVLVVDDERPLVDLIARYLEREGFRVLRAHDGLTAVDLTQSNRPDLIILDLMLPGIDGLEVCRRVRAISDAYILMLTARTEEIDRIIGLTAGADDYLTKPFSPHELVARVRAMLRRPRSMGHGVTAQTEPAHIGAGALLIDLKAHEVSVDKREVQLTPNEYDVLVALAKQPGHVLTRSQLIDIVWGHGIYVDEHVVDVHISNLRQKLEPVGAAGMIETVRGVGYRFRLTERKGA